MQCIASMYAIFYVFQTGSGTRAASGGPQLGGTPAPRFELLQGDSSGKRVPGIAPLQEDPTQVPQFELLQGGSSAGKRVLRTSAASGGLHLNMAPRFKVLQEGSTCGLPALGTRAALGGLHLGEAGSIRDAPGGLPPCSKLLQEGSFRGWSPKYQPS